MVSNGPKVSIPAHNLKGSKRNFTNIFATAKVLKSHGAKNRCKNLPFSNRTA